MMSAMILGHFLRLLHTTREFSWILDVKNGSRHYRFSVYNLSLRPTDTTKVSISLKFEAS